MQTFTDLASPRNQLSLEQLPRGFVEFPSHIVDALGAERRKFGPDIFTDAYARRTLERQTLTWYYDGLPVAYRPALNGIDVLGVGWEETAKYWPTSPDPAVKVVQP